ncbi:hypothetical protein HHI36_016813, partial [Cryptolaemus montrouzieri]
ACNLDPYGSSGWGGPPYGGAPPPNWCDRPGVSSEPLLPRTHWCERPGRSSDPVTPIGGIHMRQTTESLYNLSCPVHSPFRFRFANGGLDFHHHNHHHHHSQ